MLFLALTIAGTQIHINIQIQT